MDGFFDKYGRVIIIAVAICFVLLYLTPMRNVVGSSINGFAGNFANKVGESLGTVKMPDGSGNVAKEQSSMLIDGPTFSNTIPDIATSVVFCDEKASEGVAATDLTVAKDGDVVGWLDGTTWKVSTQNNNKKILFNEDSRSMFNENRMLTNIQFDNIDTSKVKNMREMFRNCINLETLDLSSFDTSNVTNMYNLFLDCNKLISLDLSNFNTSNVIYIGSMFYDCMSLTSLNLSSFNTSKVKCMEGMFYGCKSLISLNLSNFDTSNVETMSWMFYECEKLNELDLSNFDTSKAIKMVGMFREMTNLEYLNLSSFNTSKVTDMTSMFLGSNNLKSVKIRSQTDIDNFKTKNAYALPSVKFEIA